MAILARRSSDTLIGAGIGAALAIMGMVGRKLAVQAPTALAGDWDEALAAEHEMALALFDKLAEAKAETRRVLFLTQLKHALGKHALEEENAVYPAMRAAGMTAEAGRTSEARRAASCSHWQGGRGLEVAVNSYSS